MTFIKITDPKQREALAKELHDVKRRIQADSLQQRLEKQGLSRDLTKFFRPVVEAQEKTAAQIGKKIEDLPTMPPTTACVAAARDCRSTAHRSDEHPYHPWTPSPEISPAQHDG